MTNYLDKVPDVDIEIGRFKYILCKVHTKEGEETSKYIVRGYNWAGFHNDIYEKVAPQIEGTGHLDCECVGGGRILHSPNENSIKVYGYSQGYGKAKHSITVEVLKKKYPNHTITWSDEGY